MTNPHDPRQLLSDSIGHKGQEYIKATPVRLAAEELLEFIESLIESSGPYPFLNGTNVVSDARAVINKAKE